MLVSLLCVMPYVFSQTYDPNEAIVLYNSTLSALDNLAGTVGKANIDAQVKEEYIVKIFEARNEVYRVLENFKDGMLKCSVEFNNNFRS